MIVYVEFLYKQPILKAIYASPESGRYIFKIVFNNSNNGETGAVYYEKKEREGEERYNPISVELDKDFSDFYHKNLFNHVYHGIDLRIVYYLNKPALEKLSKPFYFKKIRETKTIFSKYPICSFYNHVHSNNVVLKESCENQGVVSSHSKNSSAYYCIEHLSLISK